MIKEQFGKLVRRKRIDQDIDLGKLSSAAGISRQALWGIEKRGVDPKISVAIKLIRALDISLDEIL